MLQDASDIAAQMGIPKDDIMHRIDLSISKAESNILLSLSLLESGNEASDYN